MLLINFVDFFLEWCLNEGFSFKLGQNQVLKGKNKKHHGTGEAAKCTMPDPSQNKTNAANHVTKILG